MVAGHTAEAGRYRELGLAATAGIQDQAERQLLERDFATIRV